MMYRVKWRTKPDEENETVEGETVIAANDDDEAWELIQTCKGIEYNRTIQIAWVKLVH